MELAVDMKQFAGAHNPSFLALQRSLPAGAPRIADFCVPCNTYFPSPGMIESLRAELPAIMHYYPARQESLLGALSGFVSLPEEQLVLANGSTELITWADRLWVRDSLVTEIPTFGRWTDQGIETGKQVHHFRTKEEDGFRLDIDAFIAFARARKPSAVVLSNPNNPTGQLVDASAQAALFSALRDVELIVIDESFLELSREVPDTMAAHVERFPNVVLMRSLGKCFGTHGLRIGYAVTSSRRARELRRALPPWNINGVAEHFLRAAFAERALYQRSRSLTIRDIRHMERALCELSGLTVYPTNANFHYVKVEGDRSGRAVRDALLKRHGILVRECSNKLGSSEQFLRIATRPAEDVKKLVAALRAELADSSHEASSPTRKDMSEQTGEVK